MGDLDGAIAEYHKAIEIDPGLDLAHNNLGATLRRKGDLDRAIAKFKTAIALAPRYALAHYNLGSALHEKRDLDGAIAAYQKAIEFDRNLAQAHYGLGNAWRDKGDLERAIAEFHKAIEVDPDYPEAHCNLGHVLRDQGRFTEACEELRRGHALRTKRPGWNYKSEEWVRVCERLVELDNKLSAVLNGAAEPAGPAERVEFAQLCRRYKRLHAAATRFYTDAFATDSKFAADLRRQHRYNAACSAALAAARRAEDAQHLPDKAVAMLRRQALGWLRDDLVLYAKLAESEDPAARQMVRERMQHWQQHADLASVRDATALDRLADDERATWRRLWADVAALRKKVEKPQ
jgi:tetratricopeptide (TPR) repeat protein